MTAQQHQVRRLDFGVRSVPVDFALVEEWFVCPVCVPVAFDAGLVHVPRARVCGRHHLHPAGRFFS